MSRAPGGRVAWVDAGRGFAIVMVVLLHSTDWLRSVGFDQPFWTTVVLLLSSVRLPLFFTISGLFARKWVEGNWGNLWRSKLSLFVWIYVLWSGIATVTFTAGLKLQGLHDATVLSQVRATVSTFWLPRFELWFIWALAIFFALAKIMRRVPFMLLLLLAACASIVVFSGLLQGNNGVEGAAKYFVFFLVGLRFREKILIFGQVVPVWAKLALIAAWAGIASVGIFLGAEDSVFGFAFVTAVAGAIAGIAMSGWLAALPFLHRLGSQTLPIYVAHTSWIIFMCWPLARASIDFKVWPGALVLPPLLAVIATWLSLVLAKVSSRIYLGRYLFEQPQFLLGRSSPNADAKSIPPLVKSEPGSKPELSVTPRGDEYAMTDPEVSREVQYRVPECGRGIGEGSEGNANPRSKRDQPGDA